MKWTTFQHARDNVAVQHEGSISDWADFISGVYGHDKDGLAICCATFDPARRKRANVREVWALMFDIDGHELPDMYGTEPDGERKEYEFAAYTTWSHGTEKGDCWRVFVPLVEPITAAEYDHVWRWFNTTYLEGVADEGAKDPSRLMYLRRDNNPSGVSAFVERGDVVMPRADIQEVLDAAADAQERKRLRAEERRRQMDYQTDDERFGWVPDAIRSIDPDCDYDTWLSVGMALATAECDGFSDAEVVWHDWSAGAIGYDEKEVRPSGAASAQGIRPLAPFGN